MLLVYLRTSMDLAIILIRWPGLAGRQAGHDEQTEVPQRARFLESPPRHVRNVISVKARVLSNKMVTVRQSFRLYEKKLFIGTQALYSNSRAVLSRPGPELYRSL